MMRCDGRAADELRKLEFVPSFIEYPEGSVLVSMGKTRVLCNVTVNEEVPKWLSAKGTNEGWVTAEYSMLPRATSTRTARETNGLGGRTQEIKRLIGRSLRAAVDLKLLGARSFIVDCDVLQADGGTRTAAITGGYVALAIALKKLIAAGKIDEKALVAPVAAISVGIINGEVLLDLCYEEDSAAEVDCNVVMNARGEFIEIQGTAEGAPFKRERLEEMVTVAERGILQIIRAQETVV